MNIVVCIKQVPDTKGGVKFNPDGTLDRAAMLAIMNPDDKAGLEAALRIKDETGAKVTVLTMGLFASANAQTFEQFPEDESFKKKKKKRRRGFSL